MGGCEGQPEGQFQDDYVNFMPEKTEKRLFRWKEVTDEFFKAVDDLHLGELLHDEGFGLFEAMSAIEMMDPKMDAGMMCNRGNKTIMGFKESLQAGKLKIEGLTPEESIGIIDGTLACLQTWLDGHSTVQTVFTNLYLHEPLEAKDKPLRAFNICILKIVHFIQEVVNRAAVFEEEDFQPLTYGFNLCLDVPESTALSAMKEAEDEVGKKVRASKENSEEHDGLVALHARLKFLRSLYATFLNFNKKEGTGSSDVLKHISSCLELIPILKKSIPLGIQPSVDPGVKSKNKRLSLGADYPTIMGFEPLINQRLLPPTFPRYTQLRSRESTYDALVDTLGRLRHITDIYQARNFHQAMDFVAEFSSHNPCVLSRSLLQRVYFPQGFRVFGTTNLSEVLKETCRGFIAPHILSGKPLSSSVNQTKELVEGFFINCVRPFAALIQAYGHNRARLRDRLAHLLEEFAAIQEEADKVDAFLHQVTGRWEYGCFSTWLLFHTLHIMLNFLLTGFELELYSPHEYHYIFWYLYEFILCWIISAFSRAESILMDCEPPTESTKGRSNKKNKNKRKKTRPYSRELQYYQALHALCGGFYKMVVALGKDKKIREPCPEFNNEQVRYEHRFAAFGAVLTPPQVPYSQFRQMTESHHVLDPIVLYTDSNKHFFQAKALLEHLGNPSSEMEVLIRVAKTNYVVTKLLAGGHKRDPDSEIQFDFSVHKKLSMSGEEKEELSRAQRARAERNRQKALLLRQARLTAQPYSRADQGPSLDRVVRLHNTKLVDTGAGFFLEEKDLDEEPEEPKKIVSRPAPVVPTDQPTCEECGEEFPGSFLFDCFECHSMHLGSRDRDEKHALIAKTDAKTEFLLKDCDFDRREPPLKFITRPNPHNSRGNMKLYLRCQVFARALEVWGSEEKLEEELDTREEKRDRRKAKQYDKKVKELRMSMRSSLYKREQVAHEHQFGKETYDSEEEEYSRTCTTCGHKESYEKMGRDKFDREHVARPVSKTSPLSPTCYQGARMPMCYNRSFGQNGGENTYEPPLEPYLLPGEVVIAEAQHTLKFAPMSNQSHGESGSLFVTNFKISFVSAHRGKNDQVGSLLPNHLLQTDDACLSNVETLYQIHDNKKKKLTPGSSTSHRVKAIQIHCHVRRLLMPEVIIVPRKTVDGDLQYMAPHFPDNILPVWTWGWHTGAALIRGAKLSIPDSPQFEAYQEMVRSSHPSSIEPLVFDLGELLPSPPDVQRSFTALQELFMSDSNEAYESIEDSFLSLLHSSQWLHHVALCLQLAKQAAITLTRNHSSVILVDPTGRDMVCVISSLTQVLIESRFRTRIGFQSLIQKEWIALAHPFPARLGLLRDELPNKSPLFLLFLDCVWQLLQQCPSDFEFSETFLTVIWDGAHMNIFDTFLFGSTWERVQAKKDATSPLRSRSLWSWQEQYTISDQKQFLNPLYPITDAIRQEAEKRAGDPRSTPPPVPLRRKRLAVTPEKRPSRVRSLPSQAQAWASFLMGSAPSLDGHFSPDVDPPEAAPETTFSGVSVRWHHEHGIASQVQPRISCLAFWKQCYLRWLPVAGIVGGGTPIYDAFHSVLVDEVFRLRHQIQILGDRAEGSDGNEADDGPSTPRLPTRLRCDGVYSFQPFASADPALAKPHLNVITPHHYQNEDMLDEQSITD
ncbi:unnamed protein product [Darwinula stevensoni]|uniref:Protein MAK10 homolog n=1 Tax=Darwinula stevensoni TaxID=69355 RepID=A0A7R9A270_9CRUS|nr:unnamed protein product [Darwinula stevensoni]CAG0878928.1 unnamed protein product [Darwinula stevensoni]